MSDGLDINDRESLEAWLEDQPREAAVWIASRAAARVLPVWWEAVLTEEWAGEDMLTPLTVLRNLLISFVAANMPTTELKSAAAAAVDGGIVGLPFSAATNAEGAARAAVSAFVSDKPVHSAGSAGFSSSRAVLVYNGAPDVWSAISTDAKQLAQGDSQYSIRLWPIEAHPLKPEWEGVRRRVQSQSDASDWQFWIDWYDALLDGCPMLGDAGRTWEMLKQIALIDPATWDKGPEVVNPVIRGIWELHRLRAEVAALQAENAAFLAAPASEVQRGHNQPPEGLVDDAPEVARQITIIWDGLDEAREELERDAPDKGVLRAIAEGILAALNAVVAYCGKVADAVVISAAKIGGGAVGTAVLDHVVNNGRLMQFAKDLLAFGGG